MMNENNKIAFSFITTYISYEINSGKDWLLAYIHEGHGIFKTNTATSDFNSGQIILIRPGFACALTSAYPEIRLGLCLCGISRDYMSVLLEGIRKIPKLNDYALINIPDNPDCNYIHLSDDYSGNLKKLIWCAAHEIGHYAAGSDEIINYSLTSVFIITARLYEHSINKASTTDAQNRDMNSLMMYIRSNFGSKLSLKILAEHTHLSCEYLSRTFKRHTGKTISEFILETRMTEAKRRLLSSSYSIYDISAYCGYQSLNSFERAFKKYTGISPASYRKKHMHR